MGTASFCAPSSPGSTDVYVDFRKASGSAWNLSDSLPPGSSRFLQVHRQ